jgi:hypothetical protein
MRLDEHTGKFIIYIALAIAIVIVLNKLFGKSKAQATAESDLDKLAAKGIFPSFPEAAYLNYANEYDSALDHVFGSEDFDTAKSIISDMRNTADLLKLEIAFGDRFHFFLTYAGEYDLRQWTLKKLSIDQVNELNSIMSGKGIQYSF